MFYLKRNLPAVERVLRLGAGLGVAAAPMLANLQGWTAFGAYATAAVLAGTALVGYCPACAMIGRRPTEQRK